jgi:AraC family transcriptional regulator
LSEYIKKVRIKRAVLLLKSGYKISNIASECGYLTTSAFSKVFRKTLSITPSEFKNLKESDNLKFSFSSSFSHQGHSIVIQPRIIGDLSHALFYIRMKVNPKGLFNENIGRAFHSTFERWYEIIESEGLWGNIYRRIGVFRNLNSISPERCHYDAGIIFNKSVGIPNYKEVGVAEVTQGKWAVFQHKGPYNTLWQTWNWIYHHWCSGSGVQLREAEPYEVYLNYKSETQPEDLLTDIYIPIS